VRLVEVRLLDGPNLYRLEPAVRIEVTVGRRRTWYGDRLPGRHALVRLGAIVPTRDAPRAVAELANAVRELHAKGLGRRVPVTIHKTSEPGHWVVAYPWTDEGEGETIARTALRMAEIGAGGGVAERAARRVAGSANGKAPAMIRDDQRRIPVISVSGTNGKSTTTRMIAHIAAMAGRHVGTTTTDGVLVNERMVLPGDFTGPQGANAVFDRTDVDLAVLETARGGILLRGLGYESNDASVLTNVSGDHLDLQGLHTLPELAEVKSVINRVTKPDGAVVLNADDPLVAAVAPRVRAPVWLFSLRPQSARIRRHVDRGGTVFVLDDGWLVERTARASRRIVAAAAVPATLGGLARHNIANALAAAAGARAMGFSRKQVADGLRDVRTSPDLLPGRLNLYRIGNRLVIVDYAHNVAGLDVLLDTAEGLIGKPGHRRATLTTIVGSAGDRPDDYLRAMAATAGERSDELAIKEGIHFLRGRTRASLIGELREGFRSVGVAAAEVPVYDDELEAIRGELTTPGRLAAIDDGSPRVVVLMCHRLRDEVGSFIKSIGGVSVSDPSEIEELRLVMSGGGERRRAARRAVPKDRPGPQTRRRPRRSAS
jgi:cyanophycin synthetase